MNKTLITLIDYGLGNLYSIERALLHIGSEVLITDDPLKIEKAQGLLLPGVGAFGEGMNRLQAKGLIEPIQHYSTSGRPLLGICLGMQLLLSESAELGCREGLGIVRGKVINIADCKSYDCRSKVPHIGWSSLSKPAKKEGWEEGILQSLEENSYVYFAHSYVAAPEIQDDLLALSDYGGVRYCAVLKRGNIYGCQFHPEKSGSVGLKILRDFATLVSVTSKGDIYCYEDN